MTSIFREELISGQDKKIAFQKDINICDGMMVSKHLDDIRWCMHG